MHFSSIVSNRLVRLLVVCVFVVSVIGIVKYFNRSVMSVAEASEWISAHTPSYVDQQSLIRIELRDTLACHLDPSKDLSDVIEFSPSVPGEFSFQRYSNTIVFEPSEELKINTNYTCRVKLGEISTIPDLADYEFSFYVLGRQIAYNDVNISVDADDLSQVVISGQLGIYIVDTDPDISYNEAELSCDEPGSKISVVRSDTPRVYDFTITGIERRAEAYDVTITGEPYEGGEKSCYKVRVPALDEFILINANAVSATEPYISLNFSTHLNADQELDGIITIDGIENIRYEKTGSIVKVYYPHTGRSDIDVRVSKQLQDVNGKTLGKDIVHHFAQEVLPPAVKIMCDGNILPDNNNLRLPFRAVNLAAVDVEVAKIYPSNILSYLQTEELNGTSYLRRYGRLIYRHTVRLDRDTTLNLHQWQDFAVDLTGLFKQERGAIYNIRLSYRKEFSLYDTDTVGEIEEYNTVTAADEKEWSKDIEYFNRNNINWQEYLWREANDPTTASYYMKAKPEINVVASDLGIIAKRGGTDALDVVVTNIATATPAANVLVTAYNYQLQPLSRVSTNAQGFASLRCDFKPFIITATNGVGTTYLKVVDNKALSTSHFDVGGIARRNESLKGFIYGERDVWRPGDDIHLTLILEDKEHRLPENHPVVMELYNPMDQLYKRHVSTTGADGMSVFTVPTETTVPTGKWTAKFKVGEQEFSHGVRVETIKPNRLKIRIDMPEVIMSQDSTEVGISAQWLSGPAAADMAVNVSANLYHDPKPFKDYAKYTFSNPLINSVNTGRQLLYGTLDGDGKITHPCKFGHDINAAGMLQANITAQVSEPGGDISISSRSVKVSPFGVYVGVDMGKGEFAVNKDIRFPVVVVNQEGRRMKHRELSYKIYSLDRMWWFEGAGSNMQRYVNSSSVEVVATGSVTAVNGYAHIPFRISGSDWGKYLILVRDDKGGHATGGIFSTDWSQSHGRARKTAVNGTSELQLTLDKNEYEVGDVAKVYLPQCRGGKVLLSIENGRGVVKKEWVSTSAEQESVYRIPVEASMSPNFYVSATLLRPYSQTIDGNPLRLFGIVGARVTNKKSILHPEIIMPDELQAQKSFTIKVKERDNKPMTYTLALVDEGLLDITNYRTPDPWTAMNRREALGVVTWDMYDDVIGAFGANFRSIHSVGGDEAIVRAEGKEKRFNPVVKFLGPFTVRGGTQVHRLTMPNYVGSVRVMVVAARQGSYGSADKSVKVTSPLMLIPTLPRTLACNDSVTMPVNVFATDKAITDAQVSVRADGAVALSGVASRKVGKWESGKDKLVDFRLVCGAEEGKGRVIVTATAGAYSISDTTYIDVKNRMPLIITTSEQTLKPGERATFSWQPSIISDASVQISTMPTINFSGAMNFMEHYPHLCTEQLTSKALFMLYGRQYLSVADIRRCEAELPRLIREITMRQTPSGGFSYWPMQHIVNDWVTTMVTVLFAEAERQGISVDSECKKRLLDYQDKAQRSYKYSTTDDYVQAFRLYSLVKSGKVVRSAMNRLREAEKLSCDAVFYLASCYSLTGRVDIAKMLIKNASVEFNNKDKFASDVRSYAISLEAYLLCGESAKALAVARKMSESCLGLSYVTQDIAFAAMSLSQLSATYGGNSAVTVREDGHTIENRNFVKPVNEIALDPASGKVELGNSGEGNVELSFVSSYRPAADEIITAQAKDLDVTIEYTDMKHKPIAIGTLKQDTEFIAHITVSNNGEDIDAVSLSYVIPSGWEIWNERVYGYGEYDHQDIRDDRANYYFSLHKGEKKMYAVRLRAAYCGSYSMAPTVCEDMYNPSCRAMTASRRVVVTQ